MEKFECCAFHYFSGSKENLHNSIERIGKKKTLRVTRKIDNRMRFPQIVDLYRGRRGILNKIGNEFVLTTNSGETLPVVPKEGKNLVVYEDRGLAVAKFSMFWVLKKIENNVNNVEYINNLTRDICPFLMKDLDAVIGLLMMSSK